MINRPTLIRIALFLGTVVAIWGVLSLGSADPEVSLQAGDLAPAEFTALRTEEVEDEERTRELQQAARDAVTPEREIDDEIQDQVETSINSVFSDIENLVVLVSDDEITIPELPEAEPGEGNQGFEQEPAVVSGLVYLDIDGNGVFSPDMDAQRRDTPLAGVRLRVRTAEGDIFVQTDAQGVWSVEVAHPAAVIILDPVNEQIPAGWARGSGEPAQLIECDAGGTCVAEAIGFVASLRPLSEVEEDFGQIHVSLPQSAVIYLAATAADDVIRTALGEPLHLATVLRATLERTYAEFGRQIEPDDLPEVRRNLRNPPPLVFHSDTGRDLDGGLAAAEVIIAHIQPNYRINTERTEQLRNEAAVAVPRQVREIREGEIIVRENERLTEFHIAAINATALRPGAGQPASLGLLAVLAVLVGVVGLYLSRFRPEIWSRPRMVALLGILMLLAATSVRATVAVAESTSWYILPVVAFGFMTAILFDQRIALLMALSVGVITAVGTQDIGLTVFAALATIAPIPFVSAVSSRGAFRNAIALSAVAAAAVAAATSWFFHVGPNDQALAVIGNAAIWAFGASAVASLLALAALQFFESAFDVTTTLSLLDLTDRNHQALQLLQEKAFGTFNHSLMVGTLADAGARAIGANPLLARAMAYYHDLGKTENPTYFIENQFGMQNPHDFIEPKESAEILRSHVTEGMTLARQFKIPTDVAQGIVSHHGDGVMRFFYEKARAQDGDAVNVDDFRHVGHKPRTPETAILMLADSLEAACRAVFQVEEPTAEAIEKVVNRIIDEKVEDGQLFEAPLTLAELTQIRKAFLDSLVGHYHQRIAYPNFPGS